MDDLPSPGLAGGGCICGGAGWDGCPVERDPVPVDLDHLRAALAIDAGRPLGFAGLLVTDRTAALLSELSAAEPPPLLLPVPERQQQLILNQATHLPIDYLEVTHARTLA